MGTFVHSDGAGGNVISISGVDWGTAGAAAQSGDLAIISWVFLNTETPTDPTSQAFSLALANVAGSTDCEGRILYRVCNGTESGAISGWSTTGSGNRQAASLIVLRGYQFISGLKVRNETANNTTHDCPALTTLDGFNGNFPADGDTILVFVFERAGSTTATPPAPYSVRTLGVVAATGTGGTIEGVADDGLTDSATFPVDPNSWTLTASTDDCFTVTMSLRPVATDLPFGLVAESSIAQALGKAKSLGMGLVSNISTALGLSRSKSRVLGLPAEIDTPQSLSKTKSLALGLVVDKTVMLAPAGTKVSSLGLTTEIDTPFSLIRSKAGGLGLALETGGPLSLSKTKSRAFGLTTESGVGLPLSATKSRELALLAELSLALALEPGGPSLQFGLVSEFDVALPLGLTKSLALGLVIDASAPLALGKEKYKPVELVTEIDTARPLTPDKVFPLGLITEASQAVAIAYVKGLVLELIAEQSIALVLATVDGGAGSFVVYRHGTDVPATLGGVVRNGALVSVTDMEVT